jgi:hypothetical protein
VCIFSRPVRDVAATSLFACEVEAGVHGTAYSMQVQNPTPVAMILPVPVLRDTGDDALTFLDLGGYDDFFDDLAACANPPSRAVGSGKGYQTPPARLKVHEVGDYVASYVPSIPAFDRLDPMFRLDPSAWAELPAYAVFGFAVFQLKPGVGKKRIHPMAYRYPAANPSELFFPTVHIHDGRNPTPFAHFDHNLYFQHSPTFGRTPTFLTAHRLSAYLLPGDVMGPKIRRTQGLVKPDRPIEQIRLRGKRSNKDHILAPDPRRPAGARLLRRGPSGT